MINNRNDGISFIFRGYISFLIFIGAVFLSLFLPSTWWGVIWSGGLSFFNDTIWLMLEAAIVLFVLFLSCLVLRNMWVRFFNKRTSAFQLYLMVFCISFWYLFFGAIGDRYGETKLYYYAFRLNNDVYHLNRIRQCTGDAVGETHHCQNKLIMRKEGTKYLNVITTAPRGKDMKFHDGLLYFHQQGCCDGHDVITVLDLNGKVTKKCEGDATRGKELMTDKAWEKLYNCKPLRKAEW